MAKLAPQASPSPRWLRDFAQAGGPPDLGAPNLAPPGGETPTFFGAYGEWMQTPPPTWEDVAWLREQWERPVHAQGRHAASTTRRRAVDAGATAISVSNHGGNNLDGTPAAIRALPASPRPSATSSRSSSTAASAAAATSSRRSRSAPARS